jgi:hypothetical protein
MTALLKRAGLLLVSTAAVGGLTAVAAPAAFAETAPATVAVHPMPPAPRRCIPFHPDRDWRWDDNHRGGGHWEHREYNRRTHRWEWAHHYRDTRHCR